MEYLKAWSDFWGTDDAPGWIKTSRHWTEMEREEKQRLYQTAAAVRAGRIGFKRIAEVLAKYPERYRIIQHIEVDL